MNRSTRGARGAITFALLVYRWLLRFYPRSFRQRFGNEMIQVFRTSCQEEWLHGGWRDVVVNLLLTVPDVVVSATREWLTPEGSILGEHMTPTIWARIGAAMAVVVIIITAYTIGIGLVSFANPQLRFSTGADKGGVDINGSLVILRTLATIFVFAGLTAVQRTRVGRLIGGVAVVGTGLNLLLVGLWVTFPLINNHPHLLLLASAPGQIVGEVGLVAGVGVTITTLISHALGRWSIMPLLWQGWYFIGTALGYVLTFVVAQQTNFIAFILFESVLVILPMTVFLGGTALGLAQTAQRVDAFPQIPQTSNAE